MIFKSFLTSIILSTDFLIHSKNFVDSYKDCGQGRVAKSATFGVKWASDESFCPSTVRVEWTAIACNRNSEALANFWPSFLQTLKNYVPYGNHSTSRLQRKRLRCSE